MHMIPKVRSVLFALVILVVSAGSFAQIGVSVTFGPPALPVYEQPLCPGEGYIWTPGYWAYDYDIGDYYWVPGTWVLAPEVGFLWTPGYWGWGGEAFLFHEGYWGPVVGFYGGIVYGFGYFGRGYEGGRWEHGQFYYNRSVNNVNITNIHNVYNTTVVNNTTTINRVSYNGGNGGVNARPTPEEEAATRQRHIPPVAAQTQHVQAARGNPELRASANHGKPPVAATQKPGAFSGREVVPAKQAGAPFNPPANRAATQPHANTRPESNVPRPGNNVPRPGGASHARDLSPHSVATPPNTGTPKLDQKYQRQQEKLVAKQNQEHQKLQQQQEKEHQQMQQRNANEARTQQLEQRHQQQTQQLEQRHTQQQEKLQTRQQPPPPRPPKK
jgi:hypothetical protein